MIPGIIQLDLKIDYRTECRIPILYAFQHNVYASCCSRDSAGVMPYVYEHVQWSHVRFYEQISALIMREKSS